MTATARQRERETEVRRLCAERGLVIEPFGRAWRIFGGGAVDLLVARLSGVSESELRPPRPD